MNLSATTSSVADVLNLVLTDASEIEKSWEADMKAATPADPNNPICMVQITRDPILRPTNLLPGLERPLHYVHSLERHKTWFEQELVKQQQAEQSQRELNTPSTSKSIPSSSQNVASA